MLKNKPAPQPIEKVLERRLRKLESSYRRLQQRAILAYALLVVGALGPLLFYVWSMSRYKAPGTLGPSESTVIASEQFTLTDYAGQTIATLGMVDGQPGLVFYDDAGNPRTTVDEGGLVLWGEVDQALVELDRSHFVVADERGRTRISLGVDENEAELTLGDRSAAPMVRLSASVGGPGLHLRDQDGEPRVFLGADVHSANFSLLDPDSKERAGMGVTANGAHLRLRDGNSAIRTLLRVGTTGETGLDFYDEQDRTMLQVTVGRDGSPGIDIFGADTLHIPETPPPPSFPNIGSDIDIFGALDTSPLIATP